MEDAVHTRALARGNGGNDCSGSGADSDSPASVGRIHDVFAEYEETFGLRKSKQRRHIRLHMIAERGRRQEALFHVTSCRKSHR